GRIGLEAAAGVAIGAADAAAGDGDRIDAAGVDLAQELRIGNVARHAALLRRLEQVEERDQEDGDDRPEREVSVVRIHRVSRWRLWIKMALAEARLPECASAASNIGSAPGLAKRAPPFRLSSGGNVSPPWQGGKSRRADEAMQRGGERMVEAGQEARIGSGCARGFDAVGGLRRRRQPPDGGFVAEQGRFGREGGAAQG